MDLLDVERVVKQRIRGMYNGMQLIGVVANKKCRHVFQLPGGINIRRVHHGRGKQIMTCRGSVDLTHNLRYGGKKKRGPGGGVSPHAK